VTEDPIQAIIKAAQQGTIVAHVEALLAAEREACAMVCDELAAEAKSYPTDTVTGKTLGRLKVEIIQGVAAAIRARWEKA